MFFNYALLSGGLCTDGRIKSEHSLLAFESKLCVGKYNNRTLVKSA